jgi:peptidoglycan-N-acetylglucosamine deacetylase
MSGITRILSVDLEDWFHILDNESTKSEEEWAQFPSRIKRNTDRILDLLQRNNQKATFFCLGWVARTFPTLVRAIAEAGHEIGCHSDNHQLIRDLGPQGFRNDLRNALSVLQDVLGSAVRLYRAPGFSVTSKNAGWFFEALIDHGIDTDCSVFVAHHGHGGFPEFPWRSPTRLVCNGAGIKEFPMTATSLFGKEIMYSGGGYFRIMPYLLIDYFIRRENYAMTYFHPRDFDADQPIVPGLSMWRRFKSYHGLRKSSAKFERLLSGHKFMSVGEASKSIDWSQAPIFDVTSGCLH